MTKMMSPKVLSALLVLGLPSALSCQNANDDSGGEATGGSGQATGGGPTGGNGNNGGSSGGQTASGGAGSETGGAPVASGGAPAGGTQSGDGGASSGGGGLSGSGGLGTGGGGGDAAGGVLPGTSGYNCEPQEGELEPSRIAVEDVASGLDTPIYITHAPDDPRLFVVEQDGVIKIIEDGSVLSTPFLDINQKVSSPADAQSNFERGLLGLAFHPDYAENGLFYVHYSDQNGDTMIAEYSVSADPNVADDESEREVLHHEQPNSNHNGGAIVFGSDGYLYIGLGDGGGARDSSGNAQNEATLLGAILRINPLQDGDNAYSSPSDNLVDTVTSAAPEVWDIGLRNPFRIAFDACSGDLAIGDVGQDHFEELNFELAGGGHHNYGWPILEGTVCTPPNAQAQPPQECGDTSAFTPPLFDYAHTSQAPSVAAGAVYRGSAFPALRGAWFFSDYGGGRLWYTFFDRDAGTISEPVELTSSLGSVGGPASIQNGSDGELYISAATEGKVLKIVLSD